MIGYLLNHIILEKCLEQISNLARYNFTYNKVKVGTKYSKIIINGYKYDEIFINATIVKLDHTYIRINCDMYYDIHNSQSSYNTHKKFHTKYNDKLLITYNDDRLYILIEFDEQPIFIP